MKINPTKDMAQPSPAPAVCPSQKWPKFELILCYQDTNHCIRPVRRVNSLQLSCSPKQEQMLCLEPNHCIGPVRRVNSLQLSCSSKKKTLCLETNYCIRPVGRVISLQLSCSSKQEQTLCLETNHCIGPVRRVNSVQLTVPHSRNRHSAQKQTTELELQEG